MRRNSFTITITDTIALLQIWPLSMAGNARDPHRWEFPVSFLHTFKGALSPYSVFYVDFLQSKMAVRRLEASVPANEKQPFAALLFSSLVPSFAIDWRLQIREYQSVALAKSFLSRTKLVFEIWSRKWIQKDKFSLNNGENFMESKTGLQSFTDQSWAVLVRRSFKTHNLSGAVAYISLPSTMYTTIIDRRDTCWAHFVWKDAWPPLFFPTIKWRKNHWTAWQCTFKG